MCIRDSHQIEPLLLLPLVENALKHSDLEAHPGGYVHILLRNEPGQLTFTVENTFDPQNQQKDDVGGVGPVSYTHLRAHETVLDLVCRLLLEQKKKTTKTQ